MARRKTERSQDLPRSERLRKQCQRQNNTEQEKKQFEVAMRNHAYTTRHSQNATEEEKEIIRNSNTKSLKRCRQNATEEKKK